MSGFWRTWLTVWGWSVVIFGLVLAGGAFEATRAPVDMLISTLGGIDSLAWDRPLRFGVGLMGAVSIGWGLTFLAIFKAAWMLGDQAGPVWRAITLSTLAWYVIDGVISVASGFALNLVPNTVLLIGFLWPILSQGLLAKSTQPG